MILLDGNHMMADTFSVSKHSIISIAGRYILSGIVYGVFR